MNNLLIKALRHSSAALTELDPLAKHHDAALIDDALRSTRTDAPDHLKELAAAMKWLSDNTNFADGQAETGTPCIERIEREVHNLVGSAYLPSYPDSAATPCAFNCDYCRMFDAASVGGAK